MGGNASFIKVNIFKNVNFKFVSQHSMIYFYHHYELPYVLQQAQLQQMIIQRQQQQQQHQHHQHQHQPSGEEVLRPEPGNPLEVVQHFSIMNGLNNLGRLRAVMLRRRRVRTFEPPAPPPPPPPPTAADQSNTSQATGQLSTVAGTGQAVDVSAGGGSVTGPADSTVTVVQ